MDGKVINCVHKESEKILLSYCNKGIYSAASLALSTCAENGFTDYFTAVGRFGENDEYTVDQTSIFDLASLTKPLVTLPVVLHLIDEQKILWTESLDSLLELDLPKRFEGVDLRSILCHSAGFSAHRNYWKRLIAIEPGHRKKWLLEAILEGYPEYEKGSCNRYSDLGYILLGFIVEIKTGQSLNHYWRTRVAEPAGLDKSLFFFSQIDSNQKKKCIPTGFCKWSERTLAGIVHDDNCRALGGVAGHAGLFGTSEGVLKQCRMYLDLYHGRPSRLPLSVETFRMACSLEDEQKVSEWSYGFNRPSASGSSSGQYFSRNSIGHLGFTGVSFWIDVEKQIIVSLLTNRVIKGEDMKGIRKMRPELYDAVMVCLQSEKQPPEERSGG